MRDSAEQVVAYQGGKGEEGVGFGEVAGSGHRGPCERHACPKGVQYGWNRAADLQGQRVGAEAQV